MSSPKITPPALRKGQTIAFLSPSARLNTIFPIRLSRAVSFFETQGFKVKVIFTSIAAGTSPEATLAIRVDEFHSTFTDPSIHAIVCTIGGITANKLLRHLDYALIRANPKIFCGHSDITPLHHALYVKAGLRTFYGPAALPNFGAFPTPSKLTVEDFFKTLMTDGELNGNAGLDAVPRSREFTQEFLDWGSDESNERPLRFETSPAWKWLRKGKAKGEVYGGCLPSLNRIANSEWWPDYTGKILLLETPEGDNAPDAVFTPAQAEMDLCDLRNYGLLDKVAGIVVGRPLYYDAEMREEFERIIDNETAGLDIPILVNLDIGHTTPTLTVALGTLAELDSENDTFEFLEPAVKN